MIMLAHLRIRLTSRLTLPLGNGKSFVDSLISGTNVGF